MNRRDDRVLQLSHNVGLGFAMLWLGAWSLYSRIAGTPMYRTNGCTARQF